MVYTINATSYYQKLKNLISKTFKILDVLFALSKIL